ncbi:sugar phosphate isomerase/epimerase family protein [Paenarthrobacter sp. PH39-S1]|uniref:sugar phosphate isomerase/epimerase family protein n=1 Tax=Paenarthrobacter sp. PH39-S1 TaxID=3046204 RepID=UPI0024B8CBF3|nr:sugar phosphate isomerase/epimerase family protein [Paenarthrobacter sp. PH39-S1]MDJ0354597.1 sugar phosphate isomerase/epimerase family protein [Paenarthrobacter sp. PH39-S1]
MRLAFSTLGAPDASVTQLIQWARRFGARGLELRVDDGGITPLGLTAAGRVELRQALEDAGVEVLALASYVRICAPGPDHEVLAGLRANLQLAADLGARGMRVFPGAGVDPLATADMSGFDAAGARRLSAVLGEAGHLGVRLLLETHDSHPRGADVARILALVDDPGAVLAAVAADAEPGPSGVGIIWDVLHPWRYGETPRETARHVAPYYAYSQFKDGQIGSAPTDVTLRLPGQGSVPLREIAQLATALSAAQGNADPWFSLEWEKAWHPELPELPVALAALQQVLAAD